MTVRSHSLTRSRSSAQTRSSSVAQLVAAAAALAVAALGAGCVIDASTTEPQTNSGEIRRVGASDVTGASQLTPAPNGTEKQAPATTEDHLTTGQPDKAVAPTIIATPPDLGPGDDSNGPRPHPWQPAPDGNGNTPGGDDPSKPKVGGAAEGTGSAGSDPHVPR